MRKLCLLAVIAAWSTLACAQVPSGAIAVTASATGTTGAVIATLAASTSRTTYICGLYASGNEAATGAIAAVIVSGTISGTLNFNVSHPVTPALGNVLVPFQPCIPANGINVPIVVTSAADAAGANITVSCWGYQVLQ